MIHPKLQKNCSVTTKARYHTAKTVTLRTGQLEASNAIAIFLTLARMVLIESLHPIPKHNCTSLGDANIPNTKNLPKTNHNRIQLNFPTQFP